MRLMRQAFLCTLFSNKSESPKIVPGTQLMLNKCLLKKKLKKERKKLVFSVFYLPLQRGFLGRRRFCFFYLYFLNIFKLQKTKGKENILKGGNEEEKNSYQ